MANALYDSGRNGFLTGSHNWTDVGSTYRVMLVDTALYTVDLAGHSVLSDIPVGARVTDPTDTEGNIASRSAVAGVADGLDVTFTSQGGASAEALVIFKVDGTIENSPLILYVDTGTGLPVTPNSGDISIVWSDGAEKIFKL